jgi:hypothetical protein
LILRNFAVKTRAAVAFEKRKPLRVTEVESEGEAGAA